MGLKSCRESGTDILLLQLFIKTPAPLFSLIASNRRKSLAAREAKTVAAGEEKILRVWNPVGCLRLTFPF